MWQLIWVYTVCSGMSVPILRVIMVHELLVLLVAYDMQLDVTQLVVA